MARKQKRTVRRTHRRRNPGMDMGPLLMVAAGAAGYYAYANREKLFNGSDDSELTDGQLDAIAVPHLATDGAAAIATERDKCAAIAPAGKYEYTLRTSDSKYHCRVKAS